MKKVLWGVLISALLLSLLIPAASCTAPLTPVPTSSELSGKSFSELKAMAISPSYDDLFRYNEQYVGKLVYYKGQVIQVLDVGQDQYQLRVNVTEGQYIWQDNTLLLYAGSRFLENDIIEFVGTVIGLITYKDVLGIPTTIPEISVVQAQIVTKAGAQAY